MLDKDERIQTFKNAWGKTRKELMNTLKIKDRKKGTKVSTAVYSAYLDAARPSIERTPELISALENVTKEIEKYLLDSDEDFNHKEWCDILTKKADLTYGQAQKIINMAFKYYYCCSDAPGDEKLYDCHMPLDKYTLLWVKEETGVNVVGWNSIDNYELYLAIQKEIRKCLESESNDKYSEYPLLAEFEIWPEFREKEENKRNKVTQ